MILVDGLVNWPEIRLSIKPTAFFRGFLANLRSSLRQIPTISSPPGTAFPVASGGTFGYAVLVDDPTTVPRSA